MSGSTTTPSSGGPASTLVLGLGNDILRDDAIGLRLAGALRDRLDGRAGYSVVQSAEMGLALLDLVTGFDRLVILDAIQTGGQPPGFLHRLGIAEFSALPEGSPHFLGVAEVLALGTRLGLPVPQQVDVFAVEVEDPHTVSTEMSSALEAALPGLADRILGFL